MKKLFLILFLVPLFATAQKVITHTVGAKESLSSIGRLYNINGRELANYNKIDYEKGLTIGQVLKIPVKTDATAPVKEVAVKTPPVKETVKTPVTTKENNAPIYHTVAKKETLYHISTLYKNATVADIKKWNHLTGDGVAEGTKIIVGYGKGNDVVKEEVKVAETKVDTKKEDENKKALEKAKEEERKTAEATAAAKEKARQLEEQKNAPVKTVETITTPTNYTKGADFKGGAFRNIYDAQTSGKNLINDGGPAGVFKSTSGWEDGKYYCLHNNAAPGTILKITNNATGKTVYAKVLDLITDIKQNNGLVIRLSNAAADALGVTDTKFDCSISYAK